MPVQVSQKYQASLLKLSLYRRGLHADAHERAVSALENILKAFMQHLIYWDADKLEYDCRRACFVWA